MVDISEAKKVIPKPEFKGRVLFVDDERKYLELIKAQLKKEPYQQFYSESGEDALEILKSENISVIVTDLNMPGMGGRELLKIVKKKYPEIIRVIVTGMTEIDLILEAIKTGETHRYITKPFKWNEELVPVIWQSLDLYQMKAERKEMVYKILEFNEKLIKQNKEIRFFKELTEKASEKKTSILTHLNKEINPLLKDIIEALEKFCEIKDPEIQTIAKALKARGKTILQLMREMENLLLGIEFGRPDR